MANIAKTNLQIQSNPPQISYNHFHQNRKKKSISHFIYKHKRFWTVKVKLSKITKSEVSELLTSSYETESWKWKQQYTGTKMDILMEQRTQKLVWSTVTWFLPKNYQNHRRDSTFQQNVMGKLGNYVQSNETRPLSLSIHKWCIQNERKKTATEKFPGGKTLRYS